MQIDINTTTYSIKQRILAFFMAFMIFSLTCPEIFEGLGVGLIVHASTEDDGIVTAQPSTSKYMGKTGHTKSHDSAGNETGNYTGKILPVRVRMYDYLTDTEIANSQNWNNINDSRYTFWSRYNPYNKFNTAISGDSTSSNTKITSPASDNITLIYDPGTWGAEFIYVYLFKNSDSSEFHPLPGDKMEKGSDGKYRLTFKASDLGSNTYDRIKFINFYYSGTNNNTIANWETHQTSINGTSGISQTNSKGKSYTIKRTGWSGTKADIEQDGGAETADAIIVKAQSPLYLGNFLSEISANSDSQPHISDNDGVAVTKRYNGNDDPQSYDTTGKSNISPSESNSGSYNNFYWQANISQRPAQLNVGESDQNYRPIASIQGLVDNTLNASGLITQNGDALPYFDSGWDGVSDGYMKCWEGTNANPISFPFYELLTPTGTGDHYGRYYQFNSRDSTLQFNYTTDATHPTPYFVEKNAANTFQDNTKGTVANANIAESIRAATKRVGYFPFNTVDSCHVVENGNGTETGYGDSGKKNNYGFGSVFQMSFKLRADGTVDSVTSSGESEAEPISVDTVFEFTGDDDLWVFIDDNLILDMGGSHSASTGHINFATGIATVDNAITYGSGGADNLGLVGSSKSVDIRNLLSRGYISYATAAADSTNPEMHIQGDINKDLRSGYDPEEMHTMKIFYMERGMSESNLFIRFNFPAEPNFGKMKVREYTDFSDVNDGLKTLTQKAAETDVFRYEIKNKGTVNNDVLKTNAKYPTQENYIRSVQDITTKLTSSSTAGPQQSFFFQPGTTVGSTYNKVANVSYEWVDEYATKNNDGSTKMNSSVHASGRTSTTSDDDGGGYMYLMQGSCVTDSNGVATSVVKSSGEFEGQFARYSLMQVTQDTGLYTPNTHATNGAAATLTTASGRTTNNYYNLKRNYIFSVLNNESSDDVFDITNGNPFNFRNNIGLVSDGNGGYITGNDYTKGDSVTDKDANEDSTVSMTVQFVNAPKTATLEIKKNVTGTTDLTNFEFEIELSDVFGVSTVDVSDYTVIKSVKGNSGSVVTGNITNVSASNNTKGRFTLTDGQTLTISGIPVHTKYTITEKSGSRGDKVTGEVSDAEIQTNESGTTIEVTVNNEFQSETGVDVLKTNNSTPTTPLEGAELELWYKETSTPPTYHFNDPKVVPYKMNGMKISKSPSEIGIPGLEEVRSSYTVYTEKTSYSNPDVPSSKDTDWILPRSDSDYIYFRDYNVGQYTADNDKVSFSSNTANSNAGKRSWRETFFADKSDGTHQQDQELGFADNDSYWYAAEFYGTNKETVKYAMWERFVDDFTYRPYGANADTTVDTVVWKIQPPDGYNQVRFILLQGDNWIRSTEKISFKLGEIYHKTNWGGVYSNGNYYDVPLNDEAHNLWAPTANGTSDQRNTAMEQPRKYEPTNQKIIFHCNSLQVWHNIHIEFFTSSNENDRVNGQAFPGYMMEPYAYAGSDYRMTDGYLTYELTIPKGATHFRINNGVDDDGSYSYMTAITPIIKNQPNVKNGGNYYILGTSENYNTTNKTISLYNCISSSTANHEIPLYQCVQIYKDKCKDDTTKIYSESNITSDCDYVYFEAPSGWNQVYAYFYGGGNLRDDNWQRACYSAWPGVAPVGTEYNMPENSAYVHSDTYSIKVKAGATTDNGEYNGTNTSGVLSPEAKFTIGTGASAKTIYRFRVPKGDRKNYSKVVFNNGLKKFSGGDESGVIDYHTGYIYKKSGEATQYFKEKPTVQYTGRTNSNYTTTDKTEYVYVKNSQNWKNLHITFYDSNGNRILQGGCGYLMDYAGNDGSKDYYRMPIPTNAAKFSVNQGKDTTATPMCDIIRYSVSETAAAPISDAEATAADKFVYDLSGNALTRLTYSKTSESDTFTTSKGQIEDISNYTSGVRKTGTVEHTLNIRDSATTAWNVPIGGMTVTFYGENGTSVGSGTMMKTNPDGDSKVWYTKKIPEGAKSFSVIYVKNGTTTPTPTYPIYSTSADANGNITTSGHMYYETSGTNQLNMIHTESAVEEADDETYEKRGDSLYLRYDSEQTPVPTVTFYGGSNVIRANVTAKYLNVQDGKYWYEISIPKGADYFSIGNDSTQYPIYELKTKYSRYQKDYTLGNMQYSVSGTTATLLYPIFEQDDEYSISVGGNTISTVGSIIPVDESQVSAYANADAEPRAATTAEDVMPVLYETDSTNVSYSWVEEATGDGMLRFDNSTLGWIDVYAEFFNSSGTSLGSATAMSDDGSSATKKIAVPENATQVRFSKSGTYSTSGEYTSLIDMSSQNNGKNRKYTPATTTTTQTNSTVYVYWRPKDVGGNTNNNQKFQWYDSNDTYQGVSTQSSVQWDYNNERVYGWEVPSNAYYVEFACEDSSNNNTWYWTGHLQIRGNSIDFDYLNKFVNGTGHNSSNNVIFSYTDLPSTQAQVQTIYVISSGTGNWTATNNGSTDTNYSATYQVEDRYGYISNVDSNADSDNFIYIDTSNNTSLTPYVIFYDSNNSEIGGVTVDSVATTGVGIKAESAGTNLYRVRLPKNAVSFKVGDGSGSNNSATAYNLYGSVTVSAETGLLANTGDTVTITNFHHAGSTFSVANDANLTITNTAVRANTPVQTDMDNPLNTKSDSDFVFLTVPSGNSWTPYAYFYGNKDGEYDFSQTTITAGTPTTSTITWPGIQASGSPYTDRDGNKVYHFQIPKGNNGTYSYVMFNNGTYASDNITESQPVTAGGNYTLDTTVANKKDYGTSVKAFALQTGTKAPSTATADYSSGDYIYIINNGTQDLTNSTFGNTRKLLDEMHVTFFSDANGGTVVGTGSLDAATNAGYIPDKVGTTNESTGVWQKITKDGNDIYRIQVPSGAKYFQINNGLGKGNSGSNYSLRKSEIKTLTVNGLYKFVDNGAAATDYIKSGETLPTGDNDTRQNPHYLLDLVNILDGGDEELPTSDTVDIHLATVVTGNNGKIASIKWLKDSLTNIDSNYLANKNGNGTSVLVKKQGEYYWKEVVAPSGYKVNSTVATFTIPGYNANNPPSITDEPINKGSLSLSKQLETLKQTEANYGEKKKFIFTVVLTAPLGTKWATLNSTSPLTFQSITTENNVAGSPVTVTPIKDSFSDNSLTRTIQIEVPATGLTDVIIRNIPSGTAYYVTEESACELTVKNSTGSSVTATVTLTAPTGIDWADYTLIQDGTVISAANISVSGQVCTVSNISVPANSSVKIGNIPDGTTYSVSGADTASGTLHFEYSKKPTAITKKVYASAAAADTTDTSEDTIEGTIPSFTTDAKNAVDYDVTNKREVGMLTLKDIVIGHNIYPQSLSIKGVNQSTTISGISTTNWYKYDYLVTLIAPEGVDLDDYISKTDLDNVTGYWTLKQDPNNANSLIHDTYHKFKDDENNVVYTERSPRRDNTETPSSYTFHINVTSAEDGFKDILNIPLGTQYTVVEQSPSATYDEEYAGQKEGKVTWIKSGDVYPRDAQHSTAPLKYVDAEHRAPVETITNEYWYYEPSNTQSEVILTKTAKEKVGTIDIGDALAGAQFKLVKVNADGTTDDTLSFTLVTADNTNKYTLGSGTHNQSGSWLTTGTDGKMHIFNLVNGDYYLEEQKAPKGYSHLDSNVLGSDLKPTKKKIYFSVGENREVKEISATDEMEPSYIRLYEHINMKKDAWGDPTFIFKIKQTGYYKNDGTTDIQTIDNGKEILVALTVDDNNKITNVVKWFNTDGIKFTADAINNNTYGDWLVEGTTDLADYQGIFDIDSKGRIRVEPGSYEITRVPVSRYEFVTNGKTDAYTNDNEPGTWSEYKVNNAKSEKLTIDALPKGYTIDVHYYDQVAYYDKFSQVDEKINTFYTIDSDKANKTIKGIRVEDYHQTGSTISEGVIPDTTSSDLVASIPSRFKAYFIYADGSEIPMDAANKKKLTISYDPNDNKIDGTGTEFADFSYTAATENDDNKITVANAANHASEVYTLKASYTDGGKTFNTKFDLVFKADQS